MARWRGCGDRAGLGGRERRNLLADAGRREPSMAQASPRPSLSAAKEPRAAIALAEEAFLKEGVRWGFRAVSGRKRCFLATSGLVSEAKHTQVQSSNGYAAKRARRDERKEDHLGRTKKGTSTGRERLCLGGAFGFNRRSPNNHRSLRSASSTSPLRRLPRTIIIGRGRTAGGGQRAEWQFRPEIGRQVLDKAADRDEGPGHHRRR